MPFNSDFVLGLYETTPGRYIIQTTVHSIIAVIIINRIKKSLNIDSPENLQKLHFIPIILPPLMLAFYYLVDPLRDSPERRLISLLDIERLLALEYGGISLGSLLLLTMMITTIIFLFQEIIPVTKNILITKKEEDRRIIKTIEVQFFGRGHQVKIIEDPEYIIFSSTGSKPSIFISTGLVNDLNEEELDAALAHEAAHIMRAKRPALIAVYIFRVLSFFNPVVLIEFRKAVQEEEKICDRMAVRYSGNPEALSSVLRKFLPEDERRKLNKSSEGALIKERLAEIPVTAREGESPLFLALAILLTGVINYFIV